MNKRGAILATVMAVGALVVTTSLAAELELVMFESSSCTWCETWNDEIGRIYNQTEEGKQAPLRRVDIFDARQADLSNIRGIVFTPTFVLRRKGFEIGRIIGYQGEDFFWWELESMIAWTAPGMMACDQKPAIETTLVARAKPAKCLSH